jgi:predicted CopG family antitoxin
MRLKTIKVEESVHSDLQSVGAYGETMSDIIAKCVRSFKEKNKK